MTQKKFVVTVSVLLFVAAAFLYLGENSSNLACSLKGGHWTASGAVGEWMCASPTTDAGKPCTTMSDCQGFCTLSDQEIALIQSGQLDYENYVAQGVCSKFTVIYDRFTGKKSKYSGTYSEISVENGKVIVFGQVMP